MMSRRFLWVGFLAVAAAAAGAACSGSSGTSSETLGQPGAGGSGGAGGTWAGPDASSGGGGSGGGSADFDASGPGPIDASPEAFFADDPPPKTCGDSGVVPKVPGGTPECPDDKNREGCPCPSVGTKAACWPGFRKHRGKGICHDGETVCKRSGETDLKWGPCEGYQLPSSTKGKEGCTCFSGGHWDIANTSPCFISDETGKIVSSVSTLPNYGADGKAHPACPTDTMKPSTPWSTSKLTVDCAGHFKLCYTLKAGSLKDPKDTDCVLTRQCAEADYTTPNVSQKWGDLPAWETKDGDCATKFTKGGYGEMSVEGTSVECDEVKKVFKRVGYCALDCKDHPEREDCKGCGTGLGGNF